jgi:hypothetical protein
MCLHLSEKCFILGLKGCHTWETAVAMTMSECSMYVFVALFNDKSITFFLNIEELWVYQVTKSADSIVVPTTIFLRPSVDILGWSLQIIRDRFISTIYNFLQLSPRSIMNRLCTWYNVALEPCLCHVMWNSAPYSYFNTSTLTHPLTHGAEAFLRSCQLCSHSRTSQHFMEPEGSLPRSQEPSTDPYPVPDRSNPYHPILSL